MAVVAFSILQRAYSTDQSREQHATAAMYAGSLLLGIKLGAKRGVAEGKVAPSVARCLSAVSASSLTDMVESVLVVNLTPTELTAADAFFATTAGIKYAKLSEVDVYTSAGEAPPEASPVISDAESKEIDNFNDSTVAHKLSKVLNSESARGLYAPRLKALANSCGAGWR